MLIGACDPDRGQVDVQPARVHTESLDRARRDPRAEILRVYGERLQRPPEPIVVEQRRRDLEQLVHRRAGRPPRDVIQRRRRAQPARDQRTHDLPDRQDRPSASRQRPIHRVLHAQLAQKVLDQQQRPNTPARARHRRIQTRERSRQRLQLPRVLQRIRPSKVCHNTMTHLPPLVPVSLDQLHVPVLAAGPLDLGLFDKHVATTLPASSDGTNASINPVLPQHAPVPRVQKTAQTQPPLQNPDDLPSVNRGKQD